MLISQTAALRYLTNTSVVSHNCPNLAGAELVKEWVWRRSFSCISWPASPFFGGTLSSSTALQHVWCVWLEATPMKSADCFLLVSPTKYGSLILSGQWKSLQLQQWFFYKSLSPKLLLNTGLSSIQWAGFWISCLRIIRICTWPHTSVVRKAGMAGFFVFCC